MCMVAKKYNPMTGLQKFKPQDPRLKTTATASKDDRAGRQAL